MSPETVLKCVYMIGVQNSVQLWAHIVPGKTACCPCNRSITGGGLIASQYHQDNESSAVASGTNCCTDNHIPLPYCRLLNA